MYFICLLFSHRASPNTLQRVFTPIRVYYRLLRWMYGNEYDPFETKIKEGLHPIPAFLKQHESMIRIIYYTPQYLLPTLFIIFIIHYFQLSNIKRSY
jgi:hypothetical protein